MKKSIAVVIALFAIGAILVIGHYSKGPDLSQYEPLRQPRIATKPDQRVLMIEVTGSPNAVGSKAFGALFKVYFRIKGVSRGGSKMPAPRARWPLDFNTPVGQWVGRYAMPVPDTLSKLPEVKADSGFTPALTTWEYGEVAEILHVGPYDAETPTIAKLKDYIAAQGYGIVGEHEEEYLKGPTFLGKGDPDKYYTIIRYRVAKHIGEPNRADTSAATL